MAGRFSIDAIDVGPDDLPGQLPALGQLRRVIPGPDRPDYVIAQLDTPLRHHTTLDKLRHAGVDVAGVDAGIVHVEQDGAATITADVIVMAARLVGQQVHQGMQRFPVNLALALNGSVRSGEQLEFKNCLPIAVAMISDRDPAPAG